MRHFKYLYLITELTLFIPQGTRSRQSPLQVQQCQDFFAWPATEYKNNPKNYLVQNAIFSIFYTKYIQHPTIHVEVSKKSKQLALGFRTDLFLSLSLPQLHSLLLAAPPPFLQILPFIFVRLDTTLSTTACHLLSGPCVLFPDILSDTSVNS